MLYLCPFVSATQLLASLFAALDHLSAESTLLLYFQSPDNHQLPIFVSKVQHLLASAALNLVIIYEHN